MAESRSTSLKIALCFLFGALAVVASAANTQQPLRVSPNLKSQLHNVELMHASRVQRRSLYFSEATYVLEFFNKTFTLNLRHNHQLFALGVEAIAYDGAGRGTHFSIDQENYWQGTVEGDAKSAVTLYISPKGFFHGQIHTEDETYILESAYRHYNTTQYQVDEYTVVYRASDLVNKYDPHSATNETGHSFCGVNSDEKVPAHTDQVHIEQEVHHSHQHRRATPSAINPVCKLTTVSDSGFYLNNGGTLASVTAVMLNHINQASQRFQGTNWFLASGTILYQNLQLSVSKIIVYTDPSTSGDPYYRSAGFPGTSGPQDLLTLLSTSPRVGGWDTCLAHLFTHYSFSGGTLGLAWVGDPAANRAGGICHTSSNTWLNTGWTTDLNNGVSVPSLMDQLVTHHEIGHNWGSPHDTAGTDCLGGGANGRYVMYPTAVDGSATNNYQFSNCSIRNITLVLQAKGNCFSSGGGFCGDYLNTTGEQCDAGTSGDSCCFGLSNAPNASMQCKYNPANGAICSDTTDICCKNCKNTSTQVCFSSFHNDPNCRANSTCSGSDPKRCPTPPAKSFGAPCGNGGYCSGATGTSASCISLCTRFGALDCTCAAPDECHVCCKHNASVTSSCGNPFANYSGQCVRASVALLGVTNQTCLKQPYWSTALGVNILYNATQRDPACTTSTCWGILDKLPNTVCSIGVCDATGTCVVLDSGNAYSWATWDSLTFDNVQKWMKQNVVGTVLIFSFVLWLPLACLVHRSDLKKRKQDISYGVRQSSTMTFRPKNTQDVSRRPGGRY